MPKIDWETLHAPIPWDALMLRPGSTNEAKTRAIVLAYVDATYIVELLNRVLGPEGWESVVCENVVDDAGVPVVKRTLTLFTETGDVSRTDYGYPNNINQARKATDKEALKAASSDALKRCAWLFGIGTELRRHQQMWWEIDDAGRWKDRAGLQKKYAQLNGYEITRELPEDATATGDPRRQGQASTGKVSFDSSTQKKAEPEKEKEPEKGRGNCPEHDIPFVHRTGTRKAGEKKGQPFDFWACPHFDEDEVGNRTYCKQQPGRTADLSPEKKDAKVAERDSAIDKQIDKEAGGTFSDDAYNRAGPQPEDTAKNHSVERIDAQIANILKTQFNGEDQIGVFYSIHLPEADVPSHWSEAPAVQRAMYLGFLRRTGAAQ